MLTFSFPDRVPLSGDEWEYQSIAVNFIHGHGFPYTGGFEDQSCYKFLYYPDLNAGHSWGFFSTDGKHDGFYRNPVYPLFISAIYGLFSVRPEILFMAQFILLILSGALLPYLCFRQFGRQGLLIGLLSYTSFLYLDSYYAFRVMSEVLIIVYIIILWLSYMTLDYKRKGFDALIMGIILGLGLLLKNCFYPLVIILLAQTIYYVFISKKTHSTNAIALIIGMSITILPWTIYANHLKSKTSSDHGFFFITTQGDDVLLASNNEYSSDGMWHPEWENNPKSFYNKKELIKYTAIEKVFIFYAQHLNSIPHYFLSKVRSGMICTAPQVFFYTSIFAFLCTYSPKRKATLAAAISSAFLLLCFRKYIPAFLISHFQEEMTICISIAVCMYIYKTVKQKFITDYLMFLLLINFAFISLIFYGSQRISGVIDIVCLVLAFYNIFITAQAPASE